MRALACVLPMIVTLGCEAPTDEPTAPTSAPRPGKADDPSGDTGPTGAFKAMMVNSQTGHFDIDALVFEGGDAERSFYAYVRSDVAVNGWRPYIRIDGTARVGPGWIELAAEGGTARERGYFEGRWQTEWIDSIVWPGKRALRLSAPGRRETMDLYPRATYCREVDECTGQLDESCRGYTECTSSLRCERTCHPEAEASAYRMRVAPIVGADGATLYPIFVDMRDEALVHEPVFVRVTPGLGTMVGAYSDGYYGELDGWFVPLDAIAFYKPCDQRVDAGCTGQAELSLHFWRDERAITSTRVTLVAPGTEPAAAPCRVGGDVIAAELSDSTQRGVPRATSLVRLHQAYYSQLEAEGHARHSLEAILDWDMPTADYSGLGIDKVAFRWTSGELESLAFAPEDMFVDVGDWPMSQYQGGPDKRVDFHEVVWTEGTSSDWWSRPTVHRIVASWDVPNAINRFGEFTRLRARGCVIADDGHTSIVFPKR
ncbi:MAG: hypothetical protein IT385_27240 [Deltaproteobacteria bacterium]|nr:hypothetical protein [Deltaproteobacteria bacterium]